MPLKPEINHPKSIGHWEVQADTGELFWSDEVYRIHGLEIGSEIDVEAAINAYHPDDRDKVTEHVRRALEEKEDYQFELKLVRADGEISTVRSTGVVRLNPDGSVRSVFGFFEDISELVESQKELQNHRSSLEKIVEARTTELKHSEARFRDFAETGSDWFWEQDGEFRFTAVTASKAHRFVNRSEETIGHTRWGFMGVNPDQDEHWRLHVEDLQAHRSFKDFRYAAIDADGNEHVFSVSGKPISSEDGRFTGYRGTVSDMTELLEATDANERFIAAINHLSEGFALWDADGKLVACNDVLREIVESDEKKMLPGITFKDWQQENLRRGLMPEAVGREEAWLAERLAYFENPVGAFEVLRRGRWHRFRLQKLPDGSTMHSVFDIHEIKQSEVRLRNFAESASDWFWETDENHEITFISEQYGERLGVPVDLIIGKSIHQSPPGDVDDAIWTLLVEKMSAHEEVRGEVQPRILQNGDVIWVSINAKPVFDSDGNFKGYHGTASEITDRVIAQQELQESEQRFKDFSTVSSDWLWESDENDRYTYFSDHYEVITGLAARQFLGKNRSDIRPPELSDEAWEKWLDDFANHRDFRGFTYSRTRPDGEKVCLSVSGHAVFDESGKFLGYRGTGSDITKEVAASKEIQRTEKMLYSAVEAMEDGLILFDAEDRLVICNQKYKDMYFNSIDVLKPGTKFEDIVRKIMDLGEIMLEDSEKWLSDRLQRHLNPSGPFEQNTARGKWIRVVEQKTSEGGTVGLHVDITKQKREENELRKLSHAVEQSSSMVFITDAEGTIEYVNPMFTKVSGYSIEEVIGENPRILKSSNTTDEVYADLWQTIKSGDDWKGELEDRRKDGSTFWAYATISPVKDEDGKIIHFVSMHEDITQRKEIEIREHSAMERAEMANRAKSELLANMSHELRTPLNAIIGFSQMFMDQIFGPLGHEKYNEYAADISNSGRHLLALINDILDVSAIESQKLELMEDRIDVAETFAASVRMVSEQVEEGGIVLSTEVADGLPKLFGDERRIKQVLLNLLSNSVKFTLPGGKISLHAALNDAGGIIFEVTDTGIGMDEMGMAQAMEQFGQVDSSLARKYEGSGLGLPLTVGLVKLHDGTFDIDSKLGEGTTVTIKFPPKRTVK